MTTVCHSFPNWLPIVTTTAMTIVLSVVVAMLIFAPEKDMSRLFRAGMSIGCLVVIAIMWTHLPH